MLHRYFSLFSFLFTSFKVKLIQKMALKPLHVHDHMVPPYHQHKGVLLRFSQRNSPVDNTVTGRAVFSSTPLHKEQENEALETLHFGLNIDLGWGFLSLKTPVWVECSQKVEDLWGKLCRTQRLMNLNVHCSRRRVQEEGKKIKPRQPQQLSENRHLCDPHNVPQWKGRKHWTTEAFRSQGEKFRSRKCRRGSVKKDLLGWC